MLEDLKERIADAKDLQMDLKRYRIHVIEPILEAMGYPISNVLYLDRDYMVNDTDGINYVYLKNKKEPIIAIDAKKYGESVAATTERQKRTLFACSSLQYLIVTNGEYVSLFRIKHQEGILRMVSVNVWENKETLADVFAPENLLNQNNAFWKRHQEESIRTKMAPLKGVYWQQTKAFLSNQLDIDLTDETLVFVLEELVSFDPHDRRVPLPKPKKHFKKDLVDITLHRDFAGARLMGVRLGDKRHGRISFQQMLKLFADFVESEVETLLHNEIKALENRTDICKITKQRPFIEISERGQYATVGGYYIETNRTQSEIVATMIEICRILDINQERVTLEWEE